MCYEPIHDACLGDEERHFSGHELDDSTNTDAIEMWGIGTKENGIGEAAR